MNKRELERIIESACEACGGDCEKCTACKLCSEYQAGGEGGESLNAGEAYADSAGGTYYIKSVYYEDGEKYIRYSETVSGTTASCSERGLLEMIENFNLGPLARLDWSGNGGMIA